MESSPDVPLEEITWHSPHHIQMMGGFIHSNNVLYYFAESPFFDPTSNNASLVLQAMHNENLRPFIETREAFEGRLKTMQGLEFMVVCDPLLEAVTANAAAVARGEQPKEPSNVWVIRKQMRRRAAVAGQDDVQILATYFIVGDSVFMAPSVWSVVGRRMLSTVTSLTKVLSTASPLLTFSPSYGHSYFPHVPKSLEPSQLGQQSSQQSKETTPMPDTQSTSGDGTRSKSPLPGTGTSGLSSSSVQDARLFAQTLDLLAKYGDEYIDETPLVGEPGSFIFTKAAAPAQDQLTVAGGAAGAQAARQRSAAGTPAPPGLGRPGTPATGLANTQPDGAKGKLEKGTDKALAATKDKGKKRKSKVGSITMS